MPQLRAVQPVARYQRRSGRELCYELFYKTDHPRGIDRYIDFFGDDTSRVAADRCGEMLLESLA